MKNPISRRKGKFTKYRGGLPKGRTGQFADLRGARQERGSGVFEGG